jgi:hypothetical protein
MNSRLNSRRVWRTALSGSGVTGLGWLWVVLAFLLDLGVYSYPPGATHEQEAEEKVRSFLCFLS